MSGEEFEEKVVSSAFLARVEGADDVGMVEKEVPFAFPSHSDAAKFFSYLYGRGFQKFEAVLALSIGAKHAIKDGLGTFTYDAEAGVGIEARERFLLFLLVPSTTNGHGRKRDETTNGVPE